MTTRLTVPLFFAARRTFRVPSTAGLTTTSMRSMPSAESGGSGEAMWMMYMAPLAASSKAPGAVKSDTTIVVVLGCGLFERRVLEHGLGFGFAAEDGADGVAVCEGCAEGPETYVAAGAGEEDEVACHGFECRLCAWVMNWC
jgi:hypothetical protein